MSAQGGIFYFDGRPIDPELPKQLGASLAEYGPDGGGVHVGPGLVMVHRALHVTPEDPLERQPYISRRGNVMTWDGRLDNREDLLLQLWRDLDNDTTDVALAMAAYEKWGEEGFAKLVGDWSLVVWDAHDGAVRLASDYMGVRPLYYFHDADHVTWSTTLGQLVLRLDRQNQFEERFIVGALAFVVPPDLTPYKGILSVTPAHALGFGASGLRTRRRFWSFTPERIRYRDESLYESHLRSLFRDAVKGRLRATSPVWAELSGGLDSSSVVCMADALIRQGAADTPALRTVSHVSDTSSETDERRFVAEVERQRGRPSHYLLIEDEEQLTDGERGWVTPKHPRGLRLQTFNLMQRDNSKVLLSGRLGDGVMGNFIEDTFALADPLTTGAVRQLLREAHAWGLSAKQPIFEVLWSSLRALRPSAVKAVPECRALLQDANTSDTKAHNGFRTSRAILRSLESDLNHVARADAKGGPAAKRWLVGALQTYQRERRLESTSDFPGVTCTYPYSHRPLVEFVVAIPWGALVRPGAPRYLMRRAFGGFVPSRILTRFSKGYYAPCAVRTFRLTAGALIDRVDSLELVKRGWVDATSLRAALRTAYEGATNNIAPTRNAVYVERWLAAATGAAARSHQLQMKGGDKDEVRQAGTRQCRNR